MWSSFLPPSLSLPLPTPLFHLPSLSLSLSSSLPLPPSLQKVLKEELGEDWREKVKDFDPKPLAAASIGQVHSAVLHDGQHVVVKIQVRGSSPIHITAPYRISFYSWGGGRRGSVRGISMELSYPCFFTTECPEVSDEMLLKVNRHATCISVLSRTSQELESGF